MAPVVGTACWWVSGPITASGDPGGQVMGQLAPAASALPGYGTPVLPWASTPGITDPYLIESEPHQDSCDGRAGTQGWSDVVVQGSFRWTGSYDALVARMTPRVQQLGWVGPPAGFPPNDGRLGPTHLADGAWALAGLSSTQIGQSPAREFVALAPPVGNAASGC